MGTDHVSDFLQRSGALEFNPNMLLDNRFPVCFILQVLYQAAGSNWGMLNAIREMSEIHFSDNRIPESKTAF